MNEGATTLDHLAIIGAPLLPVGVRHYETAGFAQSWEAYDALAAVDGWTEQHGDLSSWKRKALPEGVVTVHSPDGPRPEARS